MSVPEFGSKQAASMGGSARAKALTKEERSESSRIAAEARWEREGKLKDKTLRVTHGSEDHPLRIGDIELACYVLEDGTRIFSQRGLQIGIGMNISGGAQRMLKLVQSIGRNPKEIHDLSARITKPIKFQPPHGGIAAHGYEATILVDLCDAILQARADGKLSSQQVHFAERCEILLRGFARVGIIALIDEATGFQYARPRRDLEDYLRKYLSESLRKWVRTFPADYFKHLCRLRGVELRSDMKLPPYFGTLTNNLVYRRIAPGLLKAVKEHRKERGSTSDKLHSWLSEDVGFREILVHLGLVTGLMKCHTIWEEFEGQLDQIAPVYPEVPGLFDNPDDWNQAKV